MELKTIAFWESPRSKYLSSFLVLPTGKKIFIKHQHLIMDKAATNYQCTQTTTNLWVTQLSGLYYIYGLHVLQIICKLPKWQLETATGIPEQ